MIDNVKIVFLVSMIGIGGLFSIYLLSVYKDHLIIQDSSEPNSQEVFYRLLPFGITIGLGIIIYSGYNIPILSLLGVIGVSIAIITCISNICFSFLKKQCGKLALRIIDHEKEQSEIEFIAKKENDYFKDGLTVSSEGLFKWYKQYTPGIFLLCKGDDIIGWISFWPVPETTYHNMKKGDLKEINLNESHILNSVDFNEHSFWYIGDVFILEKYRNKGNYFFMLIRKALLKMFGLPNKGNYFFILIRKALLKMSKQPFKHNTPITFFASAASPIGFELLNHFNFDCAHYEEKCRSCYDDDGQIFYKDFDNRQQLKDFLRFTFIKKLGMNQSYSNLNCIRFKNNKDKVIF